MRLDLQCNGIEHIVSHWWGWGGADPIKPLTCSARKKVYQKVYAEDGLCFS